MGERVAIVGGGIAGLTAAYLLQRKHDVRLFEKSPRLGGNAYTHTTSRGESVDVAVAVFGKAGYPLFYRLLDELGVKTRRCPSSYMSFKDLDTGEGIYITPALRGLVAQRFDFLRPKRIVMFSRLLLGLRHGRKLMERGALDGLTLADGLGQIPELRGDARVIFLCALCLMSSLSAGEVLESPAAFFPQARGPS
ncbi:MAG: FAD-dependent oxidoreductase [Deltaproteobacteria bacterium]|nr:FAD-dependent oxidoreductase [Deltaproteobacteria bacterium]